MKKRLLSVLLAISVIVSQVSPVYAVESEYDEAEFVTDDFVETTEYDEEENLVGTDEFYYEEDSSGEGEYYEEDFSDEEYYEEDSPEEEYYVEDSPDEEFYVVEDNPEEEYYEEDSFDENEDYVEDGSDEEEFFIVDSSNEDELNVDESSDDEEFVEVDSSDDEDYSEEEILAEDELVEADNSDEDELESDVSSVEELAEEEEISYPAQSFGPETEGSVTVYASVEEGVFPEGTEMRVSPVSKAVKEQIMDTANEFIADDEEVVDIIAVDITFFYKDVEIQPNGYVNVEMWTEREVKGDNHMAVHVEEETGEVEVVADASSTETSIEAEKFSIYGILGTEPDKAATRDAGSIEWTNQGTFPYITSITITDEDGNLSTESTFDKDGKINLNYYFAIPNDVIEKAGNLYTLQIPNGFRLVGDIAERQLDEASGINATWEVHDNIITVRFYQDMDTISNVSGYMSIGCWFSKDMQFDEDHHSIEFDIGGDSYTVDVYVEEITDANSASVAKSGKVLDATTGQIQWTTTVTPDSSEKSLEGIKVVDTYDLSLQTYVPGSFTVGGTAVSDSNVTFTSTGFEYTFPKGTTKGAKVITYKTRITKDYLYNSDDTKERNHVDIYMPNEDKSSETDATVTVNKKKMTKTATSFNASTNTVNWSITVNPHKLNLKDVKIIDNFKGGYILTNTIKIGNKVTTNYTLTDNTLTVNLGDISDTVTVTFSQVITDWDAFKNADGSYTITNEASVQSENEFLEEATGKYGVGIGTGEIKLTKKGVAKVNATNGQYITWNISLNDPTNSSDYQIINQPIVFYDKLTEDLTPVTGLKIVVHYTDGSSVNQTIPLADCYNEATKEFNYTITPGVTTIAGKTVLPECWYIFTFDTSIKSYSTTTYTNTARVNIGNKTLTAPATVNISYTYNKMITKSGSYNYKTNTYNWTVTVNSESKAIENPVIVDTLPQDYTPAYDYVTVGSTKVYFGAAPVNGIQAVYDSSANTITITYTGFVAAKQTIYVYAKYSGTGEQGNAKNTVTLDADNFDETFTASNTIKYNKLPVLQKKTDYKEGDVIIWEVPFTLDYDNIEDISLEDQLISGITLDTSSVKLYYANVSAQGKITATTNEVSLGADAINFDSTTGMFILNLPADLNTHSSYVLRFNTIIMDKTLEKVVNSITFKGNNIEENTTSDEIILKVTTGDSHLTGDVGSVKIYKYENGTTKPLEGVAFQMLNKNKEEMSSIGWAVTNAQGVAEFKDCLRIDTVYYVQEVRTITGYVYDDTMYEVKIENADEDKTCEITLYNAPETTEVSGGKTWNDANNQDGKRPASITVNLLANGTKVDSATVTADMNWKYKFENLPKYANGKEITYTISEDPVTEYTTEIDKYNIKNNHTPETTEVSGGKTWNDANNQDGKRPASITVNLLANGTKIDSATVTADMNWKYKFENLPKYANGKEITYTISEDPVTEYTTEIDKYNIKNNHTPETTEVSGGKTWNDANNQDGKRPESITVNLLANGTKVDSATVTADMNWKYKFENLPKYADGKEIKYTISEDPVTEYTTEIDKYNIKNNHTPETTEVSGGKTWNDANNQDGKRPESITVNLLANGTKVDSATVTADMNWKYKFENLPKYADGKEIKYTISEDPITEYTTEIDKYNIKNNHTPETTYVEGKKIWDDGNNQDGIRPASVTINLLADGVKIDSTTATKESGWQYSFINLPKYADGQEIVYTVTEEKVEGYATFIFDYNIKNTHKPETVDVEGEKEWDDANNQDGKRPSKITVNLLADGTQINSVVTTKEDNWKYSFKNLPKYENGQKISYTVTEDPVEGYTTTISGYHIKNTYTPKLTFVDGEKTWDDANNQDGIRPVAITVNLLADGVLKDSKTVTEKDDWKYSFTNLPKYANGQEIIYTVTEDAVTGYTTIISGYNIKNIHIPETTKVEGTKTWDDKENQDGKRPISIVVDLLANGEMVDSITVTAANGWKYEFTNLPKNANGQKISYTVTERIVNGYVSTITGYDIQNTHVPETTKVEGTKTWDDKDNQDGKRPKSITVNLLADGKKIDTKVVTKEDNWKYSFTNLPKYANGQEITYTVIEEIVDEYDSTITGYDIKNTHVPETTKVEGEKKWDDNNNQDGKRPNSVIVNLLANGEKVDTYKAVAANNWKFSFTDLPKYANGQEITYTVTEDAVTGYVPTIEDYTITNTHIPETTFVEGQKTWNDKDNQDGKRPTSITVNLLANGKKVDSVTTTAEKEWKYKFTDIPKYADGQEIDYTVEEVAVEDYEATITGFDIKNTHVPETTKVEGTKTWDDKDNQDGKRPSSIIVNLFANGEKIDSKEVTEGDEWKYAFTNLPKYKNGQEIAYAVTEVVAEEYTPTIEGYDITNTYTPKLTFVNGEKKWNDADNQDGKRPQSITVNLYANGEKIDSKVVTEEDEWKYSFINLPKYAKGQLISYTVDETEVEGYDAEIVGYNITNTHVPETTKVEGTKTWDDANNQDGKRPAKITVNLLADGKVVESRTVTEADEWKYSFTNLPKYANGQEITYTVTEVAVDEYEYAIEGYDIKNTHVPETTKVEGTKLWDDKNNQDGIRPTEITVKLLADGEEIDSKVVTEEDEWKYSFTNLPKYANGLEINYTVAETALEGYTPEINGYDIKNIHIPETTKVEGTKTWDDENNQDGKRPSVITINLFANGEMIGSKTTTATNGWMYEFTELPKYANGQEIIYTVTEVNVDGYEPTITGFDIKNTHVPETTSVEGTKTWEDKANQDGIRPTSITINLLANGEKIDTTTVTAENEWTYKFNDLPKYKNGVEIIYTVTEETVEGYVPAITGYNIKNIHIPETIDIEGMKTWDDNDNQDGKRPESITVELYANGEMMDSKTVTKEDEWKYAFTNLPKYADGQEITYTVSERTVTGYKSIVSGYNIKNIYVPEKVSVEVTKKWDDENNYDKIRPESIVVKLLANGEEVETVTITAENGWKHKFTDLPKYASGKEIVYTISENKVNGYETVIDGFKITNKHKPEKPNVPTTPGEPTKPSNPSVTKDVTQTTTNPNKVTKINDSPKTGDENNIGLYLIIMLLSLIVVAGLLFKKRKTQK